MKKIQLLALSALLSLAACSGGSDPKELTDAGFKKLGTADYKGAQADFAGAIEAMESKSGSAYNEAKMGWLEATAHVDGDKAKAEFETYAEGNADVAVTDVIGFAQALLNGGNGLAAIDVTDAALKRDPGEEKLLKFMEQLKAKAKSDSGMASALEGLGYL